MISSYVAYAIDISSRVFKIPDNHITMTSLHQYKKTLYTIVYSVLFRQLIT